MFDHAVSMVLPSADQDELDRDWDAQRRREEELVAGAVPPADAANYNRWRLELSDQARRDLLRDKWASGELPSRTGINCRSCKPASS